MQGILIQILIKSSTHFSSPAFTDYVDAEGGVDGASGPVELPPDADYQEIQYDDDDDDVQAVQSETDNYLIDQSEATCRKVDN